MTHRLGKETSQLGLFIDPNQRPDSEMSKLKVPAFTKLHNPEHCQNVDQVYVISCKALLVKGLIHPFINSFHVMSSLYVCVATAAL